MLHVTQKTDCAGCGGCRPACPTGCLTYQPDGEGFLYPVVDEARCVDCGRCEAVCPMFGGKAASVAGVWACRALDEPLRRESSSGGVFSLLAGQTLAAGGAVFGAVCGEGRVFHKMAETPGELAPMRGSKYVQSEMGDCFPQARDCLDAGRRVLFSGTPCQIAGLRRFLGRESEKLLTVETLCLGVPSPEVWARYVAAREAEAGGKIQQARFREKSPSWRDYSLTLEFENGRRYSCVHQKDPYLTAFLRGVCLRPSCHDCRFKLPHAEADLTLGDYWGIESLRPELDDGGGVSLVLTHTQKGVEAFAALDSALKLIPAALDHAAATHRSLNGSPPPSPRRSAFFAGYAAGKDILPLLTQCARLPAIARGKHAAGAVLRRLGLRR